jgi:uracil-DNA glycosylase
MTQVRSGCEALGGHTRHLCPPPRWSKPWRMDEREQPPEEELRDLVNELRAHLDWHQDSGTTGFTTQGASDEQTSERASVATSGRMVRGMSSVAPAPPMPPPVADGPPIGAQQYSPAPAPPLCAEERAARLEQMRVECETCTRCALHQHRKQAVFARGNPNTDILIVGEGPGADEDEQGVPFVGKAGQLLDRMIDAMGYPRDGVYICNVVKCRPPKNRTPEPEEIAACAPYLHEQIALIAPRVIVAMGATAVRGLLGTSEGITRLRGKWKLYRAAIPVMPTFHPAYLLRKDEAKRDVWNDLKLVLHQLGRSVPEKKR